MSNSLSRRWGVFPSVTSGPEQFITCPPPVETQLQSPLFHSSEGVFTVIVMSLVPVQRLHLKHTGLSGSTKGHCANREVDD